MNVEFIERMKFVIDKLGGTSKTAEITGFAEPTIRRWLTGETEPRFFNIAQISQIVGISLNWIAFGTDTLTKIDHSEFALLPHYEVQASAGHGIVNYDSEKSMKFHAFRQDWLTSKGLKAKDLMTLNVKGDSMFPTINDKDTIVVDKSQTTLNDGLIYVLRQGDDLLVKRVQRLLKGITLISDNSIYAPMQVLSVDLENFSVIGQVVHIAHDL